jgi:hypothetical protein
MCDVLEAAPSTSTAEACAPSASLRTAFFGGQQAALALALPAVFSLGVRYLAARQRFLVFLITGEVQLHHQPLGSNRVPLLVLDSEA